MAIVDLNHVQFWGPPSDLSLYKQRTTTSLQSNGRSICTNSSQNQPAPLHNKADRISKCSDQSKSAITAARHQKDDFAARARGRHNDSTNWDNEADDDLPLIKDTLGPSSRRETSMGGDQNAEAALRDFDKPALDTSGSRIGPKQSILDNGAGDSQGTQDRPVILEDDESYTPNPKPAAISASVDASADSAFELSKPIDLSSHEAWYGVEDNRFVDKDLRPLPPLEQEGLASSLAQGQPHSRYHSPGPSHDRTNQPDDDGNTQRTSEKPGPHTLPNPLDEDGGGESEEYVSELERDMLLAFEEQGMSSSATAPKSPRPHRHSTEPPHPQIDQEDDQGGSSYGRLDDLGYSTRLREQDHDEEEPQDQQQQDVAIQAMREDDDDDDGDDDGEQRREKRRHQDEIEQNRSNVHYPENSDHNHHTSSEDEDPRPAKRRKFRVTHPRSLTPLLTTKVEIDNAQSQADHRCPPARIDDEHRHTPQTSRSPSALVESMPVAEYQEWPFQGFLKRTKIGDDITYNLEFKLPCISGQLNLPINPEALDICSSREAPAKAAIPHEVAAHSKMYAAALRPQIKRAPWTPEEDATLLKMRNEGCSWEDIHAALPHRSKGTIQVRYSTKLKR